MRKNRLISNVPNRLSVLNRTALRLKRGTKNGEVIIQEDIGAIYTWSTEQGIDDNGTTINVGTGSWKLGENEEITFRTFGAVGDGVADDTEALQASFDSNLPIKPSRGKYRTTSSLIIDPARNRNVSIVSDASWSNYSYTQQGLITWDGTKECIIFYDGIANDNVAVILASAEAVGVEPASIFDNNVYGLKMHNILIDGNNKAGFGFYGARLMEPDVYNCAVRGTTKHGWYVNGNYSGKFSKISAVFNKGCGISFGRAELDYGWTVNARINGMVLDDLYATANGSDKLFNESTNPLWGYGIGLWLHRGNVVTQYTSELNDGVALVLQPTSTSNKINVGYSELSNGYSVSGTTAITDGRATRAWGVWFVGYDGGASLGCVVDTVFGASEAIRLTGVQPSSERPEQAFELRNLSGFNYLSSDWANYRLANCNLELVNGITGVSPIGSTLLKGGVRFDLAGEALNVYEEGTWNPSIIGTTVSGTGWAYTLAVGNYTRIGRQVFFSGKITLSALSTDATGQLAISGLPFTVQNSNNASASVKLTNIANLTTAVVSIDGAVTINSTRFTLQKRTGASVSGSSLVLADLSATTTMVFSGSYNV